MILVYFSQHFNLSVPRISPEFIVLRMADLEQHISDSRLTSKLLGIDLLQIKISRPGLTSMNAAFMCSAVMYPLRVVSEISSYSFSGTVIDSVALS